MPLSVTLLLAAVGIPKLFPKASPRRVTRSGFLLLLAGIVSLMGALEVGAGAEIVTGHSCSPGSASARSPPSSAP